MAILQSLKEVESRLCQPARCARPGPQRSPRCPHSGPLHHLTPPYPSVRRIGGVVQPQRKGLRIPYSVVQLRIFPTYQYYNLQERKGSGKQLAPVGSSCLNRSSSWIQEPNESYVSPQCSGQVFCYTAYFI